MIMNGIETESFQVDGETYHRPKTYDKENESHRLAYESGFHDGPVPDSENELVIGLWHWGRLRARQKRAEERLDKAGIVKPNFPTRDIEYLIPGFLAKGELGLVVGEPGSGKTKIMIAIASHVVNGKPIDGEQINGGNHKVAILSFEECPEKMLVPMCENSGMTDPESYRVFYKKDEIGPPLQNHPRPSGHSLGPGRRRVQPRNSGQPPEPF